MIPGGTTFDVTADLSIEVDGAPVRIVGEGGQLRIKADDVPGLLLRLREAARATGATPARAQGARWADTLADGGVTAVLEAPGGRVATFGAAADSYLGAVLWGTRRIALDPAGVLRASGPLATLGAALVGTVVVVLLARRAVRRP